jgi:hypothetical protein
MKVRMVVGNIYQQKNDSGEKVGEFVTLNATAPDSYDPATIPPENNFAVGSPSAEMCFSITNPAMWEKLGIGSVVSFEISAGEL